MYMTGLSDEQSIKKLSAALAGWMNADPRNRALAIAIAEHINTIASADSRGQSTQTVESHPQSSGQDSTVAPNARTARRPQRASGFGSFSSDPITRELLESALPELESLGMVPTEIAKLQSTAPTTLKPNISVIPALMDRDNRNDPNDRAKLVGGLSYHPPSAPGVAAPPRELAHNRTSESTQRDTGQTEPAKDDPARQRLLILQRAQYHLGLYRKCYEAKDMKACSLHIVKIIATLESYINLSDGDDGHAHEEINSILEGVVDAISPKLGLSAADEKRLYLVMSRLDEHEEAGDGPTVHPSPASRAAALLNGKVAVLIGGDRREAREQSLCTDLRLRQLRWLKSNAATPGAQFEADIRRTDVHIVLLAIRWVRHGTADAVVTAARKHNKILVRLPGGMGSNAVAHAVLQQAAQSLS